MALVVNESFDKNGKTIARGTVLFDAEAEAISRNPIWRKNCTRVADRHVAHVRPRANKLIG